jgi:hypothetical protein
MKKYLFIPILLLISMSAFAESMVAPFVGLSLGAGSSSLGGAVFVGDLQAGVTFYYMYVTELGCLLETSLYTGLEINAAKAGFAWAPKIGISQLIFAFFIVGADATFNTPSNFSQLDIRLQPYAGLSLFGLLSIKVGYNFHLHGARLPQVTNLRGQLMLRIPLHEEFFNSYLNKH